MTVKADLVKILVDSVVVKVDFKSIAFGAIDKVLEPALQKVVDDSSNPFDNAAMALVYPTLEIELKKLIEKEVIALEEFFAKKLAEIKA